MNHPRILHTVETISRWNSLTQEDRRRMTVPELIKAMGELHVNHPAFKPKPRSLLPMPNLAGVQPMISEHHMSFWRLIKQTIRFALA